MPTDFPYAADAEVSLAPEELAVLRNQYEKELNQDYVSVQTKFNYAWGLVKSQRREHQVEGVQLLLEIYRAEAARRRECLYYLALGNYKLGHLVEARKFNALLLSKEPTNMQAQSLAELIDKSAARDGYIGMGIAGGAAVMGALLLAAAGPLLSSFQGAPPT
ncbi:Mitochondria fission 1 protein [Aspergillus oryzae RIB40] [Rhizoctonia solani]|uniref:Mitochondrial fission 1 protein n=1 Tax=Rhizoctonia solani TaxID=456999 RepID=A0A0K6GHQ4_9AGAM|nr:Mitochondria fission 1 protein [Aspergillus oryzae RIB40] [Rhizoctonia solani]